MCWVFFERLRLLVREDQRLIPEAWLAAPLEPTVCSLALLNTARWEGRANPDSLILPFMYLALQHPFHLARCTLTAGPRPGLTNRSQISASHVPRGASLELILASAGPELWVSVQHCTTCTCMDVWVHVCSRDSEAHRLSNATRVSQNTSTSFVSLEGNNPSEGFQNYFVMQHNHWCWKGQASTFRATWNKLNYLPWLPGFPGGLSALLDS